jgi:hypothetical protein
MNPLLRLKSSVMARHLRMAGSKLEPYCFRRSLALGRRLTQWSAVYCLVDRKADLKTAPLSVKSACDRHNGHFTTSNNYAWEILTASLGLLEGREIRVVRYDELDEVIHNQTR